MLQKFVRKGNTGRKSALGRELLKLMQAGQQFTSVWRVFLCVVFCLCCLSAFVLACQMQLLPWRRFSFHRAQCVVCWWVCKGLLTCHGWNISLWRSFFSAFFYETRLAVICHLVSALVTGLGQLEAMPFFSKLPWIDVGRGVTLKSWLEIEVFVHEACVCREAFHAVYERKTRLYRFMWELVIATNCWCFRAATVVGMLLEYSLWWIKIVLEAELDVPSFPAVSRSCQLSYRCWWDFPESYIQKYTMFTYGNIPCCNGRNWELFVLALLLYHLICVTFFVSGHLMEGRLVGVGVLLIYLYTFHLLWFLEVLLTWGAVLAFHLCTSLSGCTGFC